VSIPLLPAPPQQGVDGLYLAHHGWLLGWLRKKLSNAADAADVAHDTFLRVLTARKPLNAIEPRAYLTTIAKGLVIDRWRRQELERAYREALLAQPEHLAPSPEAQLIVLEALAAIDRLLDGLRPPVRTAFLLAQIDGLGHAAIAERLGVSVRSVERYLAEALYQCHLALPS